MKFFSHEQLDLNQLQGNLADNGAGALVSFEGRVRNSNEGKAVLRLEYEAMESLAAKEIERILEEAKNQFGIIEARAQHRVGLLEIGDVAVWVGVLAAHRQEAFLACRYVIDQIKHRVPIWKKEYYADGSIEWVNCTQCSSEHVSLNETDFYSKQVVLPEIGQAGQKKLKEARVFVLGAGGLGSAAILYLSAAGVGKIGICDSDKVETSNLHRQIIFSAENVLQSKALVAAESARKLNPFIQVNSHCERLTAHNIESIISDYDILLDCSDNLESKLLLADAAYLFGKISVHASIYQFEGQLSAFSSQHGGQCLRCLWGEQALSQQVRACKDAGVLGAIAGVIGSMQALEALKIISNLAGTLFDRIVFFDLLTYEIRQLKTTKSEDCILCGKSPRLVSLNPSLYQTKDCSFASDLEMDLSLLLKNELSNTCVIDIRESTEQEQDKLPAESFLLMEERPMSSFDPENSGLDPNQKYLLICQRGQRSKRLAEALRAQGYQKVFSARGGVDALKKRQGMHERSN